jgi:hypothetical protein
MSFTPSVPMARAPAGSTTVVTNTAASALSTSGGLTASTTQTQGEGALTAEFNRIATVANDLDTVTLPEAVAGSRCFITNQGACRLQIFPASGDSIDDLAADTPVYLDGGQRAQFVAADETRWYAFVAFPVSY